MEPRDFQDRWQRRHGLVFQSPESHIARVDEIIDQERSLLAFAREQGHLVNEVIERLRDRSLPHVQRSEHLVFLDPDRNSVTKITVPDHYGEKSATPAEYLTRLHLCNRIAPKAAYRILGILEREREEISIASEMPFIAGYHPESSELEERLAGMGWERYDLYSGIMAHRHIPSGIILKDTHPGNFLVTPGNSLVPIDVNVVVNSREPKVLF